MTRDECCVAILMLMGMDGVSRKHHSGGGGQPVHAGYEMNGDAVERFRQARWQLGMQLKIEHAFLRPEGEFIGVLVDIDPLPSLRDYEKWLFANTIVKEIEDATV